MNETTEKCELSWSAVGFAFLAVVVILALVVLPQHTVAGDDPEWRAATAKFADDEGNADVLSDPRLLNALQVAIDHLHHAKPGISHDDILAEARDMVRAAERARTTPQPRVIDPPNAPSRGLPEGFRQISPPFPKASVDTEHPPPEVPRGWFGRCPNGYIDHPTDPRKCAVPALAARYHQPYR